MAYKIGVAADPYKVNKFRKEFKKLGIEITVSEGETLAAITFMHESLEEGKKIAQKVCTIVQLHFKNRSN